MYKITAYTAKTSSKKYWCQYNLWTGDFPAYIVGCLITCSTHQTARSSGLVIWSLSVEPISLAASANFGSWRSLSRACNNNNNIFAIVQSTVSDLLKESNPLGLEWKSPGSSSKLKYSRCRGSNRCPLAWELGTLPLDQLKEKDNDQMICELWTAKFVNVLKYTFVF